MAGEGVGHLALRVDDAMPGNISCRVEVLEYVADKAGAPWQTGHRSDLTVGGNPTLGNAADYSANRRGGFVTSVRSNLVQLALRRHRQLSSDSPGQEDTERDYTMARRYPITWGRPSDHPSSDVALELLLQFAPCGKHNVLGDALTQNPSGEFAHVGVNQRLRPRSE
jgi:hypothetical protein